MDHVDSWHDLLQHDDGWQLELLQCFGSQPGEVFPGFECVDVGSDVSESDIVNLAVCQVKSHMIRWPPWLTIPANCNQCCGHLSHIISSIFPAMNAFVLSASILQVMVYIKRAICQHQHLIIGILCFYPLLSASTIVILLNMFH